MKKIIFILLFIGLLIGIFIFLDQKTRVVIDNDTGLVWEDSLPLSPKNWNQAKKYCNNLTLDGYNNWRLPHIDELMSISDKSKYKPAIKDIFRYTRWKGYWSSTKYKNDASQSWVVLFYYGFGYWDYLSDSYFVRCVQ